MICSYPNEQMAATFPPTLLSARQARAFVAAGLRTAGVSDTGLADRMAMVTSELVTNAVLHARTEIEVRLAVDDREIHLQVSDQASPRPCRAPPSTTATSGRGLVLVDALADAWGVSAPDGGTGKTVWARVGRP
jgi:anti-sigma regulatory factor (Ser/Thr protein kinase)